MGEGQEDVHLSPALALMDEHRTHWEREEIFLWTRWVCLGPVLTRSQFGHQQDRGETGRGQSG